MTDDLTPPEDIGFIRILREDRCTNGFNATNAGFLALAVHRFAQYEQRLSRPMRWFTEPLYRAMFVIVRNVFGIEIERTVRIGRRVVIGHQSGIVVHPHAQIGNDVILRHNTTLGGVSLDQEKWLTEAPIIEDGVTVGAGAMIMGKVTIGADARLGPNIVVTTDIPAGSVVVAPPPRVIKLRPEPAPVRDAGGDEALEST